MDNFWEKLNKPFTVLAPMDDVTDNVFRKVVNETARPDVFFTEFTSADGLSSKGQSTVMRKLKFEQDQHPIVAQIWSNNPLKMEKAAKIISKMGFDGIDINMGCPSRSIVKKCAGAGMIGKYDLAKSIIDAVKKGAPNMPISVKTRLGINKNIADEWVTFLLNQNLAALTIHGRTAMQMSKGNADWDEIAKIVEIKNKVSRETLIIGNGDVKSYSEVIEKYEKYNVDGVMIGRGIFTNPWIFDKKEIVHERQDYFDMLLKHLDIFEKENKGRNFKKIFSPLKKFFKMYIMNFEGANEFRIKLMETSNPNEVREMLRVFTK
ncbi:tRNA-dihydrouridine synthase [soil metagenome]